MWVSAHVRAVAAVMRGDPCTKHHPGIEFLGWIQTGPLKSKFK